MSDRDRVESPRITPVWIAIEKVERRIVRAARDVRRLEKERPGKAWGCEVFDEDAPDHATGYPGGNHTPICTDARAVDTDFDGSPIDNGPLAFENWCAGCRARHRTTLALYAARRRLRTATDRHEALERGNVVATGLDSGR